VGAAV
jgi:hypothetical protein